MNPPNPTPSLAAQRAAEAIEKYWLFDCPLSIDERREMAQIIDPFCGKEPQRTGHILQTAEPVFWCGCLIEYCETIIGVTTAAWNHRTPLPPRADWALEAAREIEADQQFGRMEPQRIKDRAAIITKHAPAAPDGEDGERLSWYEKNWEKVQESYGTPGFKFWSESAQQWVYRPTLRAALDEARGQTKE